MTPSARAAAMLPLPGALRGAARRAWAWARAGAAQVSSGPSGAPGTPSGTPSASPGTPSGTPSGSPDAPKASEPRSSPPPPLPPPVLRRCSVAVPPPLAPLQAWVESLQRPQAAPRGIAELHPQLFGLSPRLDVLHAVATWQKNYRRISYAKVKSRAEVRGGGRKPWRQKGSGRARQGSIRSPLWRGGGVAHGPRGPTSYYFLLPMKLRVLGLKVALTVKLMQDHLHVVESLEVPSAQPGYLQQLAQLRGWGHSTLIVDVTEPPANIAAACASLKTINLIPAIGLNVHSILKHQTLVLTLGTVDFLEEKLLWHGARYGALYPFSMPYRDLP